MSLDLEKLEDGRRHGDKWEFRCPACAEGGKDTDGDNLAVWPSGAYHCIVDDSAEHSRRIYELSGLDSAGTPRPAPPRKPAAVSVRPPPRLPRDIRSPASEHLARIAASRSWHTPHGLDHLVARRLLHVGTVDDRGNPALCWIVSDGVTAEARRLDGRQFPGIAAKAYSLSPKDRPIVSIPATATTVYLLEGLPDLLACAVALRVAGHDLDHAGFLCALGSGCKLGESARLLHGKRVVIAEDADQSGRAAADRWTLEAYHAGAASVESFVYGNGAKDFSDHLAAFRPAPPALSVVAPPIQAPLLAPSTTATPTPAAALATSPSSPQSKAEPPTRPPAIYDSTPWNPSETTTVFFDAEGAVAEIHRPARPPRRPNR